MTLAPTPLLVSDILNQVAGPVFALDAQGDVLFWNRACELLTGLSAGEVIGTRQHWRAFYLSQRPCLADLLVQDRHDEIAALYPRHGIPRETPDRVHAENWCKMPLRGLELYLEIEAGPIRDEQGRLVAVVESLRDVTLRQRAEIRMRTLFDSSPDPTWIIDDGKFVECNDAAVKTLGYSNRSDFLHVHPSSLSPPFQPDGEPSLSKADRMMALANEKGLHRFEWTHTRADGLHFIVEVTLSPIELGGRRVIYCVWVDIMARKRAEQAVRLYAKVFDDSGTAMLITDSMNRIVAVNGALLRDTGYGRQELLGQDPRVLSSSRTPRSTYQSIWAGLKESGYWQGELWDLRKDGTCYPKWAAISAIHDEHGAVTHYVASYTDISERKAAEERIDRLAHHDALTGLLNRYSLESRLEQSLLVARRETQCLAVFFIDLDRFKVINDTLGHAMGDRLLVEVGRRLTACVRDSDIVARLGGDEFVVVLTGMAGSMDAASLAEKVKNALCLPCLVDGRELRTSSSIGISLYPSDGDDAQALMQHADAAMYHAKGQGRNSFQFFNHELSKVAKERMVLEQGLRGALEAGQFELHYQPQVNARTGEVESAEALIRWHHPTQGLVLPMKFIPLAEETGLIIDIGAWVIHEACRQKAEWNLRTSRIRRVAVNLSAHQLRSPELVSHVRTSIESHGLLPGELELEVTESAAMADPERAVAQLQLLRSIGVDLAIDDFGTGYSSLAYLKLLPIHTLKLDRSFVRDIETDEDDAAISAATLALGKHLGLRVVAEGVETEGQQAFLRDHGCDQLQGYLFGRPEPAPQFTERWAR